MKIGFINYTPIKHTAETPFKKPLGGSESAMSYLAIGLAALGHRVNLYCRIDKVAIIRNVLHIPINAVSKKTLKGLDFLIIQNTPWYAKDLSRLVSSKTKIILWTQHASDQPFVSCLKEDSYKKLFRAFFFVSFWQLNDYISKFSLDPSKCYILRNAVAPSFINIFKDGEDILKRKDNKPILVYTSTPFRGLNLLLEVFPEIRKAFPDVSLNIYSSMKVYQGKELPEYQRLYEKAKKMQGVNYIGSLSQLQLSKELPKATILAYPNTFAETSSIAVMEAMASGLQIVTSNLGALAETTAGFAQLIDINQGWEVYKKEFVEAVILSLKKRNSKETEQKLVRQINFVNHRYTWQIRVEELLMWLKTIE
jgi:glycosyltransferase involved in cell wall biosynthesis